MADRQIFKVEFESLLPTIQAASFKDVGPGTFLNPKDGTLSVVLNTPQATANAFEEVGWDPIGKTVVSELEGLPYVEIVDREGQYRASTHTLPHRLASGYLLKHKDTKSFKTQLESDFASLGEAATVFKYCPNSLLHGVFFSHLGDGRIKMARALSGSVTAYGCQRVSVGGASHDPIVTSGKQLDLSVFEGAKKGKKDDDKDPKGSSLGIGNLPYNQDAFVAKTIEGIFIIDVAQIQSYHLSEVATNLMIKLAQFKIAKLIEQPWRIRSACDLEAVERPAGLPSLKQLSKELKPAIEACKNDSKTAFAEPPTTTVNLSLNPPPTDEKGQKKKSSNKKKQEVASEA